MSRKDKLKIRFTKYPPPSDFKWSELVLVMDHFGFYLDESGGGSHKHFVSHANKDHVIDVYRPHPSGIMYKAQLIEVNKKLKDWGLLP